MTGLESDITWGEHLLPFILWQVGIGVAIFGALAAWPSYLYSRRRAGEEDLAARLDRMNASVAQLVEGYREEAARKHDDLDRDVPGLAAQMRGMQQDIGRLYVQKDDFRNLRQTMEARFDALGRRLDRVGERDDRSR